MMMSIRGRGGLPAARRTAKDNAEVEEHEAAVAPAALCFVAPRPRVWVARCRVERLRYDVLRRRRLYCSVQFVCEHLLGTRMLSAIEKWTSLVVDVVHIGLPAVVDRHDRPGLVQAYIPFERDCTHARGDT